MQNLANGRRLRSPAWNKPFSMPPNGRHECGPGTSKGGSRVCATHLRKLYKGYYVSVVDQAPFFGLRGKYEGELWGVSSDVKRSEHVGGRELIQRGGYNLQPIC
jgi:hypothetical protein